MQRLLTEILVIGGGATGTGVLRDLAMRGFKCILVERRDLAYGTTGRFHGLLHSGARYVVKDQQAARECFQENQILRKIMPQCIEDTGGYFVVTPEDDSAYVPQFLDGCHKARIPVEPVPIKQMLKAEPLLNPQIRQCFWVPDASVDSFIAAELNAESARQQGAQVLTYHEVMGLVIDNDDSGDPQVYSVMCHDLVRDEDIQIDCDMLVNAAGAWTGKIAQLAGISIPMVPGKGSMIALNHRVVNTVINRCKMPADGDILVPAYTVAVMGTTDVKVADLDKYRIEPWEIMMLRDEGEKIIPGFKRLRILRAWAGIRPLVNADKDEGDRDISRAYVLLDHWTRDSIEGMVTITSGKWTTYRKMAQLTADLVCAKLHLERPCRTQLEALPPNKDAYHGKHYPGARLEAIEKHPETARLICECELVTEAEIEKSVISSNVTDLDDLRRDTRLGMGPCQGTFCSLRAAGKMHALRHPLVEQTNAHLQDFLQERWKGNISILWGQQLRQARLNELIYHDVLNVPNLPVNKVTGLEPEGSLPSDVAMLTSSFSKESRISNDERVNSVKPVDVIVVGGGIAGLVAGWQAGVKGKKVEVITQGWGSQFWGSGCIDIMGY